MVRVDSDWQYCGHRVIRLENDVIQVDVLPELGGKIYNFVHKPSGRNLLWHHPHIKPARTPFGAGFDDHWSGGWDELMPNDPPRPAPSGDMLPDHGEIWGQEAEWQIVRADAGACEVRLCSHGRVLSTRLERTLTLADGEPFLRLAYTLTNLAPRPIDFLWSIHPAMAISPDTRVDVPARAGIMDPWREARFAGDLRFEWPWAVARSGERIDMRRVDPPQAGLADLCYLVDVSEGWYAVTDQASKVGFALSFPASVFKHVWLFRTFGGWRGSYTLIAEASTGYPTDLLTAIRNRTCGHLEPGATLTADVKAIAYSGAASVRRVEPDGTVVEG
jgi:hypothetical protein